jgi:hypothetical protein
VRRGADPALRAPPRETDKVYTWFAIGFQEAEKVCSKFTCRFALCGKKFALGLQWVFRKPKKVCTEFTCQFACNQNKFVLCLYSVCNWFAGSRKSSLVSLHSVAKVYTGTEMFTSEVTKQQKKFALLQNKFAFQPNKFAFWQNKFAFWQNKFAF